MPANSSTKGRHVVHMRGSPFKATEEDIMNFFDPHKPAPVDIPSNALGRPSGEAFLSLRVKRLPKKP